MPELESILSPIRALITTDARGNRTADPDAAVYVPRLLDVVDAFTRGHAPARLPDGRLICDLSRSEGAYVEWPCPEADIALAVLLGKP